MSTKACILLIEPDYILRRTYEKALVGAGYEVLATDNAQEAVHLSDEKTPELVILELQLVSHGGTEFIYEFRSYAEWNEIPILLFTLTPPTALHFTSEMMKQFNIAGYLYKPSTGLQKLLRTVNEIAAAKVV
jgi:DNA-binding response OmpR family regulator